MFVSRRSGVKYSHSSLRLCILITKQRNLELSCQSNENIKALQRLCLIFGFVVLKENQWLHSEAELTCFSEEVVLGHNNITLL